MRISDQSVIADGATRVVVPPRSVYFHADEDCPNLAKTRRAWGYPLIQAVNWSRYYRNPCPYCTLDREQLVEVIRGHEPTDQAVQATLSP